MPYDKTIWHVRHREKRSEIEAGYVNALIDLAAARLGERYRTILDVPCGNGRLHSFLKKYGYSVEGFDISKEMVEEAKENGRNCWAGDMRDPTAYPDKKYDVILNWFTAFGYFDDETNERILDIWRDHLRDNGLLIIDVAAAGKDPFMGAERYDDGTIEIMEEENEGTFRKLWIRLFRDEGNRLELLKELRVRLRLYTREEMIALLEKHGFEVLETFQRLTFWRPKEAPAYTYIAVKR